MQKAETARLCSLCKTAHTTNHTEVMPGSEIYACDDCLERAKDNFIWICMCCRHVYQQPKDLLIRSIDDPELKKAYRRCRGEQLIQGIQHCVACNAMLGMESSRMS